MVGSYGIEVYNKNVKYLMNINRNITLLRGDSGSGKTYLINMIENVNRAGESSGVSIKCEVPCVTMNILNIDALNKKCIIFIDEDAECIMKNTLERFIGHTEAYLVIVQRDVTKVKDKNKYTGMAIDICAVKKINNSGRYKVEGQIINEVDRIYNGKSNRVRIEDYDTVITEDANSGFEFMKEVCKRHGVECRSAEGNGSVAMEIYKEASNGKKVLAFIDAAAYGCYTEYIKIMMDAFVDKIALLAPESFEEMILQSEIIPGVEKLKLTNPEEFADSKEYKSIERYYTKELIEETKGTNARYCKDKLNSYYKSKHNIDRIAGRYIEVNE